jgi:DNA-directed RNA polymerase subunit M
MFCEKCGSILVPGDEGFFCPQCGEKGVDVDLSDKKGTSKVVHMVSEQGEETLPRTKVECPKCNHDEAFFFVKQTRGADESPTAFYTCCKCGHKWRDYD